MEDEELEEEDFGLNNEEEKLGQNRGKGCRKTLQKLQTFVHKTTL